MLVQIVDDEGAAFAGDRELAHLGRRQPVHLEQPDHAAVEAQDRREKVLVRAVGLRSTPPRGARRAGELAHQVEVVRREVERDAGVADPRGERAQPARCTWKTRPRSLVRSLSRNARTAGLNRSTWPTARILSRGRELDQTLCLLDRGRDRFLDKHMDTGVEQPRSGLSMGLGRDRNDRELGGVVREKLVEGGEERRVAKRRDALRRVVRVDDRDELGTV